MHVIWGCYHNGVNAVVTLCHPLGLLLKRRMRSSGSMNVVRERLQDLRARGANVALDDFGVEQSNLSRLLELNVDYIKLDRSLTQSLNQNTKANSIVQSTSQLRASLGVEIIAEGIETSSQSQIRFPWSLGGRSWLNRPRSTQYHLASVARQSSYQIIWLATPTSLPKCVFDHGIFSEELCSFTRFETQCRTPESKHSNTRKSVCLVCFWNAHA